jgi:hypothetical protein
MGMLAGVVAVVLLCIGLVKGASGLFPAGWDLHPAEVTRQGWDRAIAVERYRTVREEGWSVPAEGRQVDSRREIRSYNHVLDHYETRTRQVSERVQTGTRTYTCGSVDRGNGYFEDMTCTEPEYETRYRTESYQEPVYRDDPVYDTKYTYDIEKWMPERTERASGAADEPAWPAVRLAEGEREGRRMEKYVVYFRDDEGESKAAELPLDRWRVLRPGRRAALRYPLGGGVEVLATDSLPACRRWAEKPAGAPPPDSLGCPASGAAAPAH